MIPRQLEAELRQLAEEFPVVTVLGPRQSGKTTLARKIFKSMPYVNLEAPDVRRRIQDDPRSFFEDHPNGALLDEIQRVPELLSYIQVLVDENPGMGRFVLTGSHQLELQEAISQSLAGRTGLLTLLPLSIGELEGANIRQDLDEYLFKGFFPRVYNDNLSPTKNYRAYFRAYIERDVRRLVNVKDLATFEKFIRLCAGRVGQVLNMSSLGNEVGVSGHTIKHWLSILEASFVVILLQPYFENFGKRHIKSPKLYFCDPGLASYLLDIETITQLKRDPLRGNLFENLVVLELIKERYNQGKEHHLFYYRDSQQNEVDVIYKRSNDLIPIEIKSSKTYHSKFLKGVNFFESLVGERCPEKYVVYGGADGHKIKDAHLVGFRRSAGILRS